MRLSDRYIELIQMDKEEVANIVTDLEDTLDEIEEICQSISVRHLFKDRLELANFILQRIKQVKEGD